jgi:hypothetical protein
VFDPYRLQLQGCDTRSLSAYANGGVLTQVKVPVTRAHRSLQDNLTHPVSALNTLDAACIWVPRKSYACVKLRPAQLVNACLTMMCLVLP